MVRLPTIYNIDDLKQKVRDGFKIQTLDVETKKLVLVGNEQISANKDQLIKTTLKCDLDEITAFMESDFYQRSLLQIHERGIMLIDLADFSKLSNDDQVRLITRFQFYVGHLVKLHKKQVENVLSTGDGYYIVFNEAGFKSMLKFVMRLIQQLSFYNFEGVGLNSFCFRIALNIGTVHYFYDINDRWNYVGDGMNDAQRIIDFIPSDKENAVYLANNVYELHQKDNYTFGPRQIGLDKHKKEHHFVEVFYKKI